jgi:hypothetical protein
MYAIATPIPATGRTALAILASISLLLSLLVSAEPASATDGTQLNAAHVGTSWDDSDQNANCSDEDLGLIAEGEVLWHFVLTEPSSDEAVLTAEFEAAGTVAAEDADKPSTTLHVYVVTGPDTLLGASTDTSGGNLNLSHICNKVTAEGGDGGGDQASLKVRKVDEDDNRLADAVFTVEGQDGTFTTDENGEFCLTGLPLGEVFTVTEIEPPAGFAIVGDASQEVEVDSDGDCDSPDATFVNRPVEDGEEAGSLEIRVETDPDGSTESFAFEASYEAAGFALSDGGAFGPTELVPGDYTVVELLTQAQIDAGWSLTAIVCTENGDAIVDLDAGSVTVTVDDGDVIICTFENALAGQGTLGGTPRPSPREGTQGGVPDTAAPSLHRGSPIAVVIALAMLIGLSVTTLAAARARVR